MFSSWCQVSWGFVLGYADQEEGEPTEQNVRADRVLTVVVDEVHVDGVLQVPIHPLDLMQLLAPEHHILSWKIVVAGADEVLAVQLRFVLDLGPRSAVRVVDMS